MRQILRYPAMRRILTAPATWRLIYHGGDVLPVANPAPTLKNWLRTHLHEHSCLDIMMVLRGRGWYGLDGKVFSCRPGTIFIFLPHQPHPCGYPPDHGDFEHLWIGVMRGEVLARALTGRHNRVSYSDRVNSMISLEQCGLPCPLSLPSEHMPAVELRLRITALVAALLAGILADNEQRTVTLPDRQPLLARKISAIRRHILDTGGRNANLDHLAHLAGYSKFHFLRLFKQETNQTVHTYVNQCRRRKAQELRANGLSLKEISAQLGFASPSAFSHWLNDRKHSPRRPACLPGRRTPASPACPPVRPQPP